MFRWNPGYLWIYNSYLFEVICLCTAKLIAPRLVTVLELEDLPRARRREGTGMIKTHLDAFALEVALRIVNGITMVQKNMCRFKSNRQFVWYLPVLLSRVVTDGPKTTQRPMTIGYFGGLNAEKGIDILIALIRQFNGNCRWIVCGSGPMERELRTEALAFPDRFRFLGCLDDQQFQSAFGEVDAIINLHKPLESFARGVFPYKLLEAVAHGKIVISTPMIGCPEEVAPAIHWLEGNPLEAGLSALSRIEEIKTQSGAARQQAQKWVIENFSSQSAIGRIFKDLQ